MLFVGFIFLILKLGLKLKVVFICVVEYFLVGVDGGLYFWFFVLVVVFFCIVFLKFFVIFVFNKLIFIGGFVLLFCWVWDCGIIVVFGNLFVVVFLGLIGEMLIYVCVDDESVCFFVFSVFCIFFKSFFIFWFDIVDVISLFFLGNLVVGWNKVVCFDFVLDELGIIFINVCDGGIKLFFIKFFEYGSVSRNFVFL